MSLEAISAHSMELHWWKGREELDAKPILRPFAERQYNLGFPFATIVNELRLIEDLQVRIVVPWRGESGDDEAAERLLHDSARVPRPGPVARRLEPYVVQIAPKRRGDSLAPGAVCP